jgi:hypothetical protein
MKPLKELLAQRDTVAASELMLQVKEGLSKTPAQSGPGAQAHQLALDYFRLDERASFSSFSAAFKKYPATARTLLELCRAQGLDAWCTLMQSVLEAHPKPTGAFKSGLQTQMQAPSTQKGLLAALNGFASVAFASDGSEADMELSLGWHAVEDCVLDQLERHADMMDFDWGPTERAKRQQAREIEVALAATPAVALLQALLQHARPQVLAQAPEWDREHEGAPADIVSIAVQHVAPTRAMDATTFARLEQVPAAAQLLAVYRAVNGAALFCTDAADAWSAGFVLLADDQWEDARGAVLDWLISVDFQDDVAALPDWVRTAIPFGVIPGDASHWILPVEGPFAGTVLLSNDDVSAETFRYRSFDAFIATLVRFPESILGNGGYISYLPAQGSYALYPVGYQASSADNRG